MKRNYLSALPRKVKIVILTIVMLLTVGHVWRVMEQIAAEWDDHTKYDPDVLQAAQCRITNLETVYYYRRGGKAYPVGFRMDYLYRWKDATHAGNRYSRHEDRLLADHQNSMEVIRERYKIGSEHTCYINPQFPDHSVLTLSKSGDEWIPFFKDPNEWFAILLFPLLIWVSIYLLRDIVRSGKDSAGSDDKPGSDR